MTLDTKRLGEEVRGYPSATTAITERLAKMRETAGAAPALTLTVQRQAPAGELVQRVLFQTGGPVSERHLEESVAYAFGNKVRYLNNSGHRPLPDKPSLVCAFVELNAPAKAYDTEGLQGMKVLAENVFADANDKIWRSVGEGDARMLVQDTEDDLSSLLTSRNSHSIVTASLDVTLEESFTAGDGVVWYDAENEQVRCGVAVSNSLVFDFDNRDKFASVDKATVLLVDEAPEEVTIAAGLDIMNRQTGGTPAVNIFQKPDVGSPLDKDNMIQKHLAYMSTLYSTRGEYFQRLKSLLQNTYVDKMKVA